MVDKRTPNVKDRTEPADKSAKFGDFLTKLRERVSADEDASLTWRQKLRTARNQRQGVKRVTTHPYPGAPDIPLPETDKLIRKAKPNFVLAAVSGKDYMTVKPMEGVQQIDDDMMAKAEKSNLAMNHLFKKKIPWIQRLTLAADQRCEKGHAIFKIIDKYTARTVKKTIDLEDFEKGDVAQLRKMKDVELRAFISDRFGMDLENERDKKEIDSAIKAFRKGKTVIGLHIEEVTMQPDVPVPMAEKIYVPAGTTDINQAIRITHEYYRTTKQLKEMGMKGIVMKDKVEKIIAQGDATNKTDDDLNETMKDQLEGVNDVVKGNNELWRIHETSTWYQPDGENTEFERWTFIFMANMENAEESLIKFMPYPYEQEGWGYEKDDNEILDTRYYSSRGYPEQIRAIQSVMEAAINNMLIRDEMNNNPMYTVLDNSDITKHGVQFIPGQKLTVGSHEEIRQLNQVNNVDVSSQQIMNLVKAFAEEYIGGQDQLFRNATNAGGGKTLGEVDRGLQIAQFIQNLDIINWLETLRRVYVRVFNLYKERLTTPLLINGVKVTREDFQFTPDITPNGSLDMVDRRFQAQKAFNRLGIVRQAKADGVATLDNVYAAYQEWIEKDGVSDSDRLLTDPKVILQAQVQQMEAQAQQLNQLIAQQNKVLEEGEKSLDKLQDDVKKEDEKAKDKKRQNEGGGNGRPAVRQS